MLTLSHLAALLRALADKAEELAAQEAAEAETRSDQREADRREQIAADLEAVAAIVAQRPGLPTRELKGALGLAGMGQDRAQRAIAAALHTGQVVSVVGPGRAQSFYLPTDIPKS